MIRLELFPARNVLSLTWIAFLLLALTAPAFADIYRWVDEGGVIHFTDDPSSIPEKNRRQAQDILKAPPSAGKPSLSTIGASAPPAGAAPAAMESFPQGNGRSPESFPPSVESTALQSEQLRAKIAAKEQFIDAIDRKRSNIINPLGNRFVDPADLELYRKYQEELPADRARLKELESGLSPGVN